VLTYGGRAAELWWREMGASLERQDRLAVVEVSQDASGALAQMVDRSMRLQVTIQDDHVLVANGTTSVSVDLQRRKNRALPH
jgi:uncharacterized protein YaeQ